MLYAAEPVGRAAVSKAGVFELETNVPRALHVFDADQANMFGMRGVVVESDLDQPLHGALRRQIVKM